MAARYHHRNKNKQLVLVCWPISRSLHASRTPTVFYIKPLYHLRFASLQRPTAVNLGIALLSSGVTRSLNPICSRLSPHCRCLTSAKSSPVGQMLSHPIEIRKHAIMGRTTSPLRPILARPPTDIAWQCGAALMYLTRHRPFFVVGVVIVAARPFDPN